MEWTGLLIAKKKNAYNYKNHSRLLIIIIIINTGNYDRHRDLLKKSYSAIK